MVHSHVYSLRPERVYSSSMQKKIFTIDETRQNCDTSEPQEDAQGTRQIRRGNETPEQRERRLQIQREQETTEQRQHRLAQQRQRRQD